MGRYRKRPIVVEAEQFQGTPIAGVYRSEYGGCYVETIQGRKIMISPGEWVIQEGDGVHAYPCDPTVFERTYEPCPAATDLAPATFCGHRVNQGYPCLECQAAGIAAPEGTAKEE